MNLNRINELRIELAEERISYGELAEIESAYGELVQNEVEECVLAGDMLDELEEDFHERARDLQDMEPTTFVGHTNRDDYPETVLDEFLDWLQFEDGEYMPGDVVSSNTYREKLSKFLTK